MPGVLMPRQAFIDAPVVLHHVIARGIDRTAIFRDEKDHRLFLDQMGIITEKAGTACHDRMP